jgi:hypothetical protein
MNDYDRSFVENWRQDLHAEGQYLREEIDKLCELALKGLDEQKSVEAALAADREASLRDMFAAAALGAIVSRSPVMPGEAAQAAYTYADAMMFKRKC